MGKIRVLLVDDQEIIRNGLTLIVNQEPDMTVVGQAENGVVAVQKAQALTPDIVLMDIKMPQLSGIQATRQIRDSVPGARVIILTTYDVDGWVFDGIRAGAKGYLLKDTPADDLVAGIRRVHEGESLLDPAIAGKVMDEFRRMSVPETTTPPQSIQSISAPQELSSEGSLIEKLTEREAEILTLMSQGLNNRDIAAQLFLTEGTVRNYVSSILSKLHANDRTQAVIKAAHHKIVKL